MNRPLRLVAYAQLFLVFAVPARAGAPCDAGLALGDVDPLDGAAAIELCDVSTGGSPGVVGASYGSADLATPLDQLANGALGVGLLPVFGTNVAPRAGTRMLALSSGTARNPFDPGYQSPAGFDKGYSSGYPAGLPYEIPACPGIAPATPHDSVALRLVLQVPSDAHSFSFQFKFHTYDFPDFVCSSYNDWFFATLSPAPATGPNVAFDSQGNPITADTPELLAVCTPQAAGGLSFPCASGAGELAGTGFDGRGATPWLTTRVPVTPGSEITLDLGIFDAGDGVLDSTVLIDDFRWSSAAVASPITTVPEPVAWASALAAIAALSRARGPRRVRHRRARTAARSRDPRARTRTRR